jgi:hypothetical protein
MRPSATPFSLAMAAATIVTAVAVALLLACAIAAARRPPPGTLRCDGEGEQVAVVDVGRFNLGNALSCTAYWLLVGRERGRRIAITRAPWWPGERGERRLPRLRGGRLPPQDGEQLLGLEAALRPFHDMPHETCPALALREADALRAAFRAAWPGLPRRATPGSGTAVHIRCSDVPNPSCIEYLPLEFDWYVRALRLLPAAVTRRVTLWSCLQHPHAARVSPVCEPYLAALRDHLADAGFAAVTVRLGCGAVLADFEELCAAEAIVSAGCGGSFGFWAAALSPASTPAVVPLVRSPVYCEVGRPAHEAFGEKHILHGHRVDPGRDPAAAVVARCAALSAAPGDRGFDGTAYYINREQDDSRREHMRRELARWGFRGERATPVPGDSPQQSLLRTHEALLERAARRTGWTVILEDDVTFAGPPDGDLLGAIRAALARAHRFVFLGACLVHPPPPDGFYRALCTHAYAVTADGAAALLMVLRHERYRNAEVHVDQIFQRHVAAPVLSALAHGPDPTHVGCAFQDRTAPFYKGTTITGR